MNPIQVWRAFVRCGIYQIPNLNKKPSQLTQWGPRRHHALELHFDHRGCSLELGSRVVDEELHRDVVQPRKGLQIVCSVLAVF